MKLNYYTVDGGHMFPKAEVAQIERSQRTAFLYRDLDLSRSVSTCWQTRTNWRV
jgi:hypothetical protein